MYTKTHTHKRKGATSNKPYNKIHNKSATNCKLYNESATFHEILQLVVQQIHNKCKRSSALMPQKSAAASAWFRPGVREVYVGLRTSRWPSLTELINVARDNSIYRDIARGRLITPCRHPFDIHHTIWQCNSNIRSRCVQVTPGMTSDRRGIIKMFCRSLGRPDSAWQTGDKVHNYLFN